MKSVRKSDQEGTELGPNKVRKWGEKGCEVGRRSCTAIRRKKGLGNRNEKGAEIGPRRVRKLDEHGYGNRTKRVRTSDEKGYGNPSKQGAESGPRKV